jgi:hypothetical protein
MSNTVFGHTSKCNFLHCVHLYTCDGVLYRYERLPAYLRIRILPLCLREWIQNK